jgi:hypothetical protein
MTNYSIDEVEAKSEQNFYNSYKELKRQTITENEVRLVARLQSVNKYFLMQQQCFG